MNFKTPKIVKNKRKNEKTLKNEIDPLPVQTRFFRNTFFTKNSELGVFSL